MMGIAEALDFSSEGSIPFAIEGKVDHQGEGLVWVEGVSLLSCKYTAGVGIWSCMQWS